MHAVILDGSERDDTAAGMARQVINDELSRFDWSVESVALCDLEVADCRGCFGCWTRTPGVCIIDDAGRNIAKSAVQCDLLILLTPVTFGGYSFTLKKAIDRLIPNVLPFFKKIGGELHHVPRYDRYPRFVVIGVLSEPDAELEGVFSALAERNAINLYSPAHATEFVTVEDGFQSVTNSVRSALLKVEAIK
jgi:multimeric flavodoxin WrbA